jgi:hypothetical protein
MTGRIRGSAEVALPVPPGLHLHPHQRDGIAFAVNRLRTHRGVMFGDVMGVGKTIEAIGTANVLGPRRILVVCPASVTGCVDRRIDGEACAGEDKGAVEAPGLFDGMAIQSDGLSVASSVW